MKENPISFFLLEFTTIIPFFHNQTFILRVGLEEYSKRSEAVNLAPCNTLTIYPEILTMFDNS